MIQFESLRQKAQYRMNIKGIKVEVSVERDEERKRNYLVANYKMESFGEVRECRYQEEIYQGDEMGTLNLFVGHFDEYRISQMV